MSEFGNETATATMKAGEKTIDALMKLLKFIMERNDRKLSREYKKEQIKAMKERQGESLTDYLDKKRGLTRASKLFKSGERLIPISMPMSQQELARFNTFAKLEGITFTAVADKRVMEQLKAVKKELKSIEKDAEKQGYYTEEQQMRKEELLTQKNNLEKQRNNKIVIIRAKDLELVKDITERMNMEIQLDDINNELNDLEKKGTENFTQEEKARYEDLQKEKENILSEEFSKFNGENNDVIYQSSVDSPQWEQMSFEKAINRVTERKYAENPCYCCERTNPDNYMEVTSEKLEHEGRTFTNTEYKVFNDNIEQKCDEFAHGRFSHYSRNDGENSTTYGDKHWNNMKQEIKEKGNFSDDILIFSNKRDFEKYREEFAKTKEKVTPREDTVSYEADSNSYKDYMGMINKLKGQLDEHNLSVNAQKEVCKADSGEVIHLDKNMSDDERIEYADACNVAKQIDVYEKLNENQTQIAFIRQQEDMNDDNFEKQGKPDNLKEMYEKMRENLHKQVVDKENTNAVLKSKLSNLQTEREQLASIPIVNEIQKSDNSQKLYDFVQSKESISIGDIQRHEKVGFVEASKIMEKLEREGLVSKANGNSKKEIAEQREVLTKDDRTNEYDDNRFENSTHREEHFQSKQQWNRDISQGQGMNLEKGEAINIQVNDREM